MDPRLIHFYNEELQRLRSEAIDFAQEYRSAAGMLKLQDGQVADPYVERLLEGVAYLSARVRLKLDSQFPDFTQQLLEVLFPGWQTPVPAACIVQLKPLSADPRLNQGHVVPRQTLVVGSLPGVRSEFETTAALVLWPLRLCSLQYQSRPQRLGPDVGPDALEAKAALRIELDLQADNLNLAQLPLDVLRFFVAAEEPQASQLMELAAGRCIAAMVSTDAEGKRNLRRLADDPVRHVGLGDDEALMAMPVRGHAAFRLLREYAALREKFNFFEVKGLRAALQHLPGRKFFLHLQFSADYPRLGKSLAPDALRLYCTPAINLRKRSLERLDLVPGQMEYQVVVDRHRVQDQEMVQILEVVGGGQGLERPFSPLYEVAASGRLANDSFYALRRTRRLVTEKELEQQRKWARSADGLASVAMDAPSDRPPDSGAEAFIALSERKAGPPAPPLRYLSIKALCMDREGPRWLRAHPADAQYKLEDSLPAETAVLCVVRPSEPVVALVDGFDPWMALGLLSSNYLSLVDSGERPTPQSLRGLLSLFYRDDGHYLKAQGDALQSVAVESIVRRLPRTEDDEDPAVPMSAAARSRQALLLAHGFRVSLRVSERGFDGGSPFVLGALLAAYLRTHVGVNSFVETELSQAGWPQPLRWRATPGLRPGI